jgi:hypothetical protein
MMFAAMVIVVPSADAKCDDGVRHTDSADRHSAEPVP